MKARPSRLAALLALACWFASGAGAGRPVGPCRQSVPPSGHTTAHHHHQQNPTPLPGHDPQECCCPGACCCSAPLTGVPTDPSADVALATQPVQARPLPVVTVLPRTRPYILPWAHAPPHTA